MQKENVYVYSFRNLCAPGKSLEKGSATLFQHRACFKTTRGAEGGFRTFTISNGQTGSDHIGVSDGLHLVDVVTFDASVEQLVDRVEKRHHLEETLT